MNYVFVLLPESLVQILSILLSLVGFVLCFWIYKIEKRRDAAVKKVEELVVRINMDSNMSKEAVEKAAKEFTKRTGEILNGS